MEMKKIINKKIPNTIFYSLILGAICGHNGCAVDGKSKACDIKVTQYYVQQNQYYVKQNKAIYNQMKTDLDDLDDLGDLDDLDYTIDNQITITLSSQKTKNNPHPFYKDGDQHSPINPNPTVEPVIDNQITITLSSQETKNNPHPFYKDGDQHSPINPNPTVEPVGWLNNNDEDERICNTIIQNTIDHLETEKEWPSQKWCICEIVGTGVKLHLKTNSPKAKMGKIPQGSVPIYVDDTGQLELKKTGETHKLVGWGDTCSWVDASDEQKIATVVQQFPIIQSICKDLEWL